MTQDPDRFRERLPAERRARFEELVEVMCVEENLTDALSRGLVRDYVTSELLQDGARDWLFEKGLVLADEYVKAYAQVNADGDRVPLKESPYVPASLLEAYDRLSKLKQRVHERLRAATGKTGDTNPGRVAEEARARLRELFPDTGGAPAGEDA